MAEAAALRLWSACNGRTRTRSEAAAGAGGREGLRAGRVSTAQRPAAAVRPTQGLLWFPGFSWEWGSDPSSRCTHLVRGGLWSRGGLRAPGRVPFAPSAPAVPRPRLGAPTRSAGAWRTGRCITHFVGWRWDGVRDHRALRSHGSTCQVGVGAGGRQSAPAAEAAGRGAPDRTQAALAAGEGWKCAGHTRSFVPDFGPQIQRRQSPARPPFPVTGAKPHTVSQSSERVKGITVKQGMQKHKLPEYI